jgi:hypothetical protein
MGKLFEYIKAKISNGYNRVNEPYVPDTTDDWETRNKHLKGLRRQYRKIMDEEEIKKIKTAINQKNKERGSNWIKGKDNILKHGHYMKFGKTKFK